VMKDLLVVHPAVDHHLVLAVLVVVLVVEVALLVQVVVVHQEVHLAVALVHLVVFQVLLVQQNGTVRLIMR